MALQVQVLVSAAFTKFHVSVIRYEREVFTHGHVWELYPMGDCVFDHLCTIFPLCPDIRWRGLLMTIAEKRGKFSPLDILSYTPLRQDAMRLASSRHVCFFSKKRAGTHRKP